MGMVESDIEMVLNERDIKTFAVAADNNFAYLNVLDNVLVSMINTISGFGLNLNCQFIYDKCSNNGHPEGPLPCLHLHQPFVHNVHNDSKSF
jgi:hypothetical protein